MQIALLIAAALAAAVIVAVVVQVRKRHIHLWLKPYIRQTISQRAGRVAPEIHLLLCVADHYEPKWGGAARETADARVSSWVEEYPTLFEEFRDSDGRPPQHTFFYPIDEYEPAHVDALAELCRKGFGEIEVHLHHQDDTADNLRRILEDYTQMLAARHGLLARRRETGAVAYGFIHGNWALDNSRPDGCWCGVNNELDVLRETGCYADFTLPSAPSPTQTRKINSIYYAADDPRRPKSHDDGVDVGVGPKPQRSLLLVQGPLLLSWRRRMWGVPIPSIENGCLQRSQPPSMERLDLWLRAGVQVPSRPDWYFVKLHTHGAAESNQQVVLGRPMVDFHKALAARSQRDRGFHFHYVTAREMYNLAKAAESGWRGSVDAARDFELLSPWFSE